MISEKNRDELERLEQDELRWWAEEEEDAPSFCVGLCGCIGIGLVIFLILYILLIILTGG